MHEAKIMENVSIGFSILSLSLYFFSVKHAHLLRIWTKS